MRVAHLADIHLGFRAYNRVTRQGLNVREADVFNGFRQAISKIAEIEPDLIVIAGDLFHVVRPSNLCIEHTFKELLNFRQKTTAPLVIIGGNHDSPRSVDTGCILDLFKNVSGTYVVHHEYQGIEIPELETTVFCLCHRAVPSLSNLKVEPNPNSRHNILTIHGTLEGVGKNFYDMGQPITRSQIMHDGWDYIALGHYHVHEQLDERVYYSGSLDYTSPNIWQEIGSPKGFIEYDVSDHRLVKFHHISTRDVVDLRAVEAEGLSAAEVNELIQQRVAGIKGGHAEKIVRLVVEDAARAILPDLDYRTIRQLRIEALHFELTIRPPKREGGRQSADGSHATRSLEDEWREFAKEYQLSGDIERDELIGIGLEYLGREAASSER